MGWKEGKGREVKCKLKGSESDSGVGHHSNIRKIDDDVYVVE